MAQPKKALVLSGGGGRRHLPYRRDGASGGVRLDGGQQRAGYYCRHVDRRDQCGGPSLRADGGPAQGSAGSICIPRKSTGFPATCPPAARPLLRFMLRSVLTSEAHGGSHDTLPAEERGMSAAGLLSRLGKLFPMPRRSAACSKPRPGGARSAIGWISSGSTARAAPALLLAATELQTGALRVFCNRELSGQPADTIILDHLMAS